MSNDEEGYRIASRARGEETAVCVVCGTSIVGNGRKKYCSVRCASRAARERRRATGAVSGPRPRADVDDQPAGELEQEGYT